MTEVLEVGWLVGGEVRLISEGVGVGLFVRGRVDFLEGRF